MSHKKSVCGLPRGSMTSLVLSVSNVPLALRTSWGLLAELAQVPMASALRRTETSGSVQYSATSVGASMALAQLLPALDDEVDLSGVTGLLAEDSDTREQRLRNLKALGASTGARSFANAHRVEWPCSEELGKLAYAATLCSKAVYGEPDGRVESPTIRGCSVELLALVRPSGGGRLKASALFEAQEIGGRTMLIAAIRGSASFSDWLVNFDNGLSPCPDLLNFSSGSGSLTAHKGFSNCARTLLAQFVQYLASALTTPRPSNQEIELVFTGHSAGGAVAMLLYAHFLTNKPQYPWLTPRNLRFSCLTFGAPPIFNTDPTPLLDALQARLARPGHMLAFAAEGDPVSRMDGAYAAVVANMYYRASIEDEDDPAEAARIARELPPLSLYRLGKIVVLRDEAVWPDELSVGAYVVGEEEFRGWLWVNFFAHKKTVYVKWMEEVGMGDFNGRRRW